MPGVSGIGGGAPVADLMKILEQGQAQSIDLVKKLIKIGAAEKVTSAEAEGKGQMLDLLA
jgi:hypothetical protein